MRRAKRAIAAILLTLILAATLWADGGTLILRKQVGGLTVSVFSSPVPLRVGPADLSVMVQKSDQSPVLDAKVMIHLTRRTAENVTDIALPARHSDAGNKLLYAAKTKIPSEGVWNLRVDVEGNQASLVAANAITVESAEPPLTHYWPYFALPLLAALAFALNRFLRRRMMARSR